MSYTTNQSIWVTIMCTVLWIVLWTQETSCQTTKYYSTVVAGGFIPQLNPAAAKDSVIAYPMGLHITSKNELYIGSYYGNIVKKLRSDNIVEVVAGNGLLGHDGYGLTVANNTRMKYPVDVKVNETTGEIYVADIFAECIRKVFPNGTSIIIGGVFDNYQNYLPNAPIAINATIGRPTSLALLDGDVYFADPYFHTIGKISADGQYSLVAGTPGVAGYNNSDGKPAIEAQFNLPRAIAVNSKKEILVMDSGNFRLRKILTNGTIITIAGTGKSGSTNGNALLSASFSANCWAIAIDPLTNSVFITDGNSLRRLVNETIVETVAGSTVAGFSGDGGPAISASFRNIRGVAVDTNGNIYISDFNHRIRKIDYETKIVTTIAGTGESGYTENAKATQVALALPYSYVNENGEIFIVDTDRYSIRKVNKSNHITTICGNGVSGEGTNGPAINSQLTSPKHITQRYNGDLVVLDSTAAIITASTGKIYFYPTVGVPPAQYLNVPQFSSFINRDELLISDTRNHRILRINVTSAAYTIIGSGKAGYADSDAFVGAQFNSPMAAVMDKNGDIIIADTLNSLIRKAYANGTVTTIAGVYGTATYNGDGILATQASLNQPYSVGVNSIGEVFIVDTLSNRVRKIRSDGIIVTIAGTGIGEFNVASGESTQVSTFIPRSISVLSNGDIYISEYQNNLIRKLTPYCQSNQYFNTTLQACVCNQDGYYGDYCELFKCNNILFNSTLACSAHGQCISPNNCSCYNGYFGSNCDLFNCDEIGCLHNVTCSGPGTCLCPQEYGGLRCEYLMCYNKTEIDSNVCGGHGACIAYNNCTCNSDWYGKDCSVTNCYGIPSNQSNSCGGNGTCTGPDKCTCNTGRGGSECQYLVCNNKLETDSQICSARGKCVAPDNCQCNYGFVGSNCQYYQVYLDIPNALVHVTDGPIFNTSTEFYSCSQFIGSSQLSDLGESDFVKCYWTKSVFKIYLGYGNNIGDGYILYFSNDVVVRVNASSSLTTIKSMSLTSSVNDLLSTLPQSQDVVLMSNTDDYFHNFKTVKRVWSCSRCSTEISNRLALFVNSTMVHIPISMMNSLSLDQNYLKSIDLVLSSTSSIGMTSSDAEKSARIQPSTKSIPPSITWQGNNVKKSGYSCVGHNCIVEVGLNSLNTSISYTFSGFFSLLNSDFANKQMVRLVNVYEGELVDSEYSSNAQIYCFHLRTFITLSYQYDFIYTTFDRLDFVLLNVNRTYSLNDISSISISPTIDDPFITTFTVSDYLSYQYECYQIASATDWTILGGNLCSSRSSRLDLDLNSLNWAEGTYLIKLTITVTQTYLTRNFNYTGWIELVSGISSPPTISYSSPPAISPSHQSLTLSAVVKSDSQTSLSWKLISGKLINVDGNELTNIATKSLNGYSKKSTIVLNNSYLMQGESYTLKLSATNQNGKTDVYFTTRIDQTPRFSCSYSNLRNEANVAYESLLAISCFNLPSEPISAFQVEFYTSRGSRINTVSNTFKKNIITSIPIYSADDSVKLVVKLLNRYGSMSNFTRSISVQLPSSILNGTNTFNSRYSYVNNQFYILKRSQSLRVDTSSSIHSLLSVLIQNSTIYQFVSDAKSSMNSLDSMNAMFKDMISLLKSIDGITYKVEEKIVQLLLPTISNLISILDLTDTSTYVETQIETWLTWIYSGMSSAKSYYSSLIISQLLDDQHFSQIQTMHNILVRRYADDLNKQQVIQDFTSKFALLTGYTPNNSSSLESIEISDQLNGKSIQVSDTFSTNINLPSDLSSQITSSSDIRLFYSSSTIEKDYSQGNILISRPVIDVTLYDTRGKPLSVSNLNTPISIRFGELKTNDKEALNMSCIYYDSSLQVWSKSGIQSTYSINRRENGYVYLSLECNTTHLSLFSVQETALTPNQTVSSSTVKKSDDSSLVIILSTVIPISVILIVVFIIVIIILTCVIHNLKNKKSNNEFLNKTNVELDFMSGDFPTESIFFQPLTSISSSENSSSSSFNPMSRYLNLERIGQGAFGSVFKADDVKTSTKKAIKVMKFTSMEELNSIMKEGSQLMNVSHPNILKVNDFFVSKDQLLCIDMDFYELGDLQKLTKQDSTCSESIVRQIIEQMCSALDYIHNSMNIIHRDIKPTNIFIKKMDENEIHIIVADFGLAKANSASIQNSYAGTPLYMSPELGFGASYSHNTDVYSLGVTIYQIMTKDIQTSISQLYVMKDQGEVKKIIKENLSKCSVNYSPKLIESVIAMIDKDPLTRPQARDILTMLQK